MGSTQVAISSESGVSSTLVHAGIVSHLHPQKIETKLLGKQENIYVCVLDHTHMAKYYG